MFLRLHRRVESLLVLILKKKKLVINEIVTYTNILFSLADDLDNAGIATYATQRIHESGVRCGL